MFVYNVNLKVFLHMLWNGQLKLSDLLVIVFSIKISAFLRSNFLFLKYKWFTLHAMLITSEIHVCEQDINKTEKS